MSFEPSPKVLNRVKFRGIGWQEEEDNPRFLGSRKQALLAVKRSIVHHNHASFLQGWKKLVGKPEFKQRTVHRAIILQRRKDPAIHLGCNDPASLVLAAADPAEYFLASVGIAIFPIQVRIYSAFVHICNLFLGIGADLRLIRRYFFLVLFPVPRCLFLRVIFRRFIARQIAEALHPNSSAISF